MNNNCILNHMNIPVTCLQSSEQFYVDVLGLDVTKRFFNPEGEIYKSCLDLNGFDLILDPDKKTWCGDMYLSTRRVFHHLISSTEEYSDYWHDELNYYTQSKKALEQGRVTLREFKDIDLAVFEFRAEPGLSAPRKLPEYASYPIHEMAANSATRMNRIIYAGDKHLEFRYRYESWVESYSPQPSPRVNLDKLVRHLNQLESSEAGWSFQGIDAPYPRLLFKGNQASGISPGKFMDSVIGYFSEMQTTSIRS